MYVSIFLVRVVVTELRRRGVREDALLVRSGITKEELLDPNHRLPLDRYEVFLRAARQLGGGDVHTGLHVGESWPTSGYLVGHLLTNAASIRDGLGIVMRYRKLVNESMCLRLVEDGDKAHVIYECHSSDEDNAAFEAEALIVFLLRMGHLLAGFHRPPSGVSFVHARPRDVREYVRIFGSEPTFGARHNSITFSRMILDVPNVHCDPSVTALLERRAEHVMKEQDSDSHLVERVRDLMRVGSPSSIPSATRIAERLGTSTRVLQRRLRDVGTSLSELGDDVRRTLACEAILDGNVPIKELADRLGFSEPSAFHRAFKRWTGTTPQGYRAQNAGQSAFA